MTKFKSQHFSNRDPLCNRQGNAPGALSRKGQRNRWRKLKYSAATPMAERISLSFRAWSREVGILPEKKP